MAEKIGLEAVMDMAGFNKGMKQYTGGIDEMTDKTEKGSSVFSKLGGALGTVAKVGIGAAIAGFGALTAVIVDSVKEAAAAQKVEAQLDAVLKATGGAAGMTKDEIYGLADALSRVTPYEDDMIAATETVLLQFRSIGKDVFPQATEMALDLAQRLGIDTTSAAKLLGKALEEPGEGLARLKQAGVAFTDEQEAMIQKMVAAGDTAGAQKFIMDELGKSIGGAAQAAGDTFAGKMTIMQNAIGNVKESIGAAFLPVLTQLVDKFSAFVQDNAPAIQAFFQGLADWIMNKAIPAILELYNWLATYLPPIIQVFSDYWTTVLYPALQAIWSFIQTNVIPILAEVYNWLATNLPPAIAALSEFWTGTLQPALAAVWSFIQTNLIPIFQTVAGWFSGEGTSSAMGWVDTIRGFIGPVIQFMAEQFGFIVAWVKENWPLIQKTIQTVMNAIKAVVEAVLTAIKKFWDDHGAAIMKIVQSVWNIIKTTIETTIKVIAGIIKAIMQAINGDWSGAWETIKGVADTIMKGIQKLITEAMTIIKTIWDEAMKAIQDITGRAMRWLQDTIWAGFEAINKTWQWAINTVKAIWAGIGDWAYGVGASIVNGIKQGLKDLWDSLMNWIRKRIQEIKQMIEELFTIGSPSKWATKVGQMVTIGLGKGFEKGFNVPIRAVLEGVQDVKSALANELGAGLMTGYNRQALAPAYAASQNINVSFGDTTINSGLDAELFQAQVLQTVTRAVRGY